jgi:hypothetical protein
MFSRVVSAAAQTGTNPTLVEKQVLAELVKKLTVRLGVKLTLKKNGLIARLGVKPTLKKIGLKLMLTTQLLPVAFLYSLKSRESWL